MTDVTTDDIESADDLAALTGAGSATGDKFPIWDASAVAWKSMTRAELKIALEAAGLVGEDGNGDATVTRDLSVGRDLLVAGNTGITGALTATGVVVSGELLAGQCLRFGTGGTYSAGTLFADPNYGALLRAYTAGPTTAEFGFFTAGGSALGLWDSANFYPGADNTQNLGKAANRWATVYAATGTINTSGADAKIGIREPSDAERRAARRILDIGPKLYRFKDAYDAKGDAARLHAGYIAEDVRDALAAEGLDPWTYGFMCADPITVRDTGQPVMRLGLRYSELEAFLRCAN